METIIRILWRRVEALRVAVIAMHREARCYERKRDIDSREIGELIRSLADELSDRAKAIQEKLRDGKND